MDPLGAALIRSPGWRWGRHARAGMLFRIDSGYLRVRERRGSVGGPGEPDPDDLLVLVRQLRRGAPVHLVLADPATAGWLAALSGHTLDRAPAEALLDRLRPPRQVG